MGEVLGNAGAESSRGRTTSLGLFMSRPLTPALSPAGGEGVGRLAGDEIEGAEADAEIDGIATGANAGDDFAENSRPILEAAAIFAGPSKRAQEFVEQVAVAVFAIDELGPHVAGN